MKRLKVGGRTRTAYEQASLLFKEDISAVSRLCRKDREKIRWDGIPDRIADRYRVLPRKTLKQIAMSPDNHGPGTYERQVVYALRYAFDLTFVFNGEESYIFNPLDDNDSRKGTKPSRCLTESAS